MPGWAGSSQYFNRYMDPHNDEEIFSQEAINYWQDVDLYIGGSEHATGHLLYSRFWQKFMFDKGLVPKDEFAKKLINQGMITGTSAFVFRIVPTINIRNGNSTTITNLFEEAFFVSEKFISLFRNKKNYLGLKASEVNELIKSKILYLNKKYLDIIYKNEDKINARGNFISFSIFPIHADVSLVNTSNELDIEGFLKWRPEYSDTEFIKEKDAFKVHSEVEKMSKSKYNVVNPDDIVKEYGADSLRMYEMFLGPLEQSKPWNTAGITGVHSFLKKLWKLYHSGSNGSFYISDTPSSGGGQGRSVRVSHPLKT